MKVAVTLIHATREMTNILISLVEGLSVIIFIRDLLFFHQLSAAILNACKSCDISKNGDKAHRDN